MPVDDRAFQRYLRIRRRANTRGEGDSLNYECDNRDEKGLILLAELSRWIYLGESFCHLRFGDGEIYSIAGKVRRNSDGAFSHPDTLGVELLRVLRESAAATSLHHKIRIGGHWEDRTADVIERLGLRYGVPWCSANAFYDGLPGLQTKEFIERIIGSRRRRVLVASERSAPAARLLAADHIVIPLGKAWESSDSIYRQILSTAGNDSLVIFCAGMASCVWGWKLWKTFPQSQIVDFGHIFDACLGFGSRRYMQAASPTPDLKRIVKKHYRPMFQV